METKDLKTPPHSAESERCVIGSVLADTQVGDDARVLDLCQTSGITEDSFYDPKCRLLYKSLLEMSTRALPLDSASIVTYLEEQKRLDTIGGIDAIENLVANTPSVAHAEYHIRVLKQKETRRRLMAVSSRTIEKCYDEAQYPNTETLLGETETEVLGIGDEKRSGGDWKTAIKTTLLAIENLFEKGADQFEGLSTGFRYVDEKLMGLKPGEMIVIAARPSVGKTSFAMNIAECAATGTNINGQTTRTDGGKKHPVLIFSLEMDQASLAKRMLCGRAHASAWRINRGLLTKPERAEASTRLAMAASELEKAPLFIDDASGLDVADLRARARRMKKQHGIELIVIDYLQLCNCREYAKQGRQQETSRISNQIKAMAKELKVPVIVLSQLSRANEQRGDKFEKPKLSDLRDSGAIEQDADVVMLLRRPQMIQSQKDDESLKNVAYVDVAKHRNGETGEVKMRFDGEWTRFGDMDPKSDAAQEESEAAAGLSEGEAFEGDPAATAAAVENTQQPVMVQQDLL